MRSGPLYSHRKDDLDEQSRQLKLKKVNCALRFSWLILRMSTSSSAWSSRQLPALRCRCGWVTSSADAMRTASAPCLQSKNREAKASVARAEDDEQWTGISAAYRHFFTGKVSTGVSNAVARARGGVGAATYPVLTFPVRKWR